MNNVNAAELQHLQATYRGLPNDSMVAYADETYRLADQCHPGESPFYVMSAVLIRRDNHEDVRDDLADIAGSSWWHTTDRHQTSLGRAQIHDMLGYLAKYQDTCILTVRHDAAPDETEKDMRAACLTALLGALGGRQENSRAADLPPLTASMLVLEKQKRFADTRRDSHTISQAVKNGIIDRNFPVRSVSPAIERLLWLPDLVSHTYRRYITHDDRSAKVLDTQSVTVELVGKKSDPLGAAAYVQGVSLPSPVGKGKVSAHEPVCLTPQANSTPKDLASAASTPGQNADQAVTRLHGVPAQAEGASQTGQVARAVKPASAEDLEVLRRASVGLPTSVHQVLRRPQPPAAAPRFDRDLGEREQVNHNRSQEFER